MTETANAAKAEWLLKNLRTREDFTHNQSAYDGSLYSGKAYHINFLTPDDLKTICTALETIAKEQVGYCPPSVEVMLNAHEETPVDYSEAEGKHVRINRPATPASVPDGFTGLYDKRGKKILVGNIVHWTDGGDELPLAERIASRWDRIAVVGMEGILPTFRVIDSPNKETALCGHTFNYGSFIYKDTENFLTVVAESVDDYRKQFSSAGECMSFVLSQTEINAARKEGEK